MSSKKSLMTSISPLPEDKGRAVPNSAAALQSVIQWDFHQVTWENDSTVSYNPAARILPCAPPPPSLLCCYSHFFSFWPTNPSPHHYNTHTVFINPLGMGGRISLANPVTSCPSLFLPESQSVSLFLPLFSELLFL